MIEFNKQEQQAIKQIFETMKLDNNKSVVEEILSMPEVPHGKVRLKYKDWRALQSKLRFICEGEHHYPFDLYDIGGEG